MGLAVLFVLAASRRAGTRGQPRVCGFWRSCRRFGGVGLPHAWPNRRFAGVAAGLFLAFSYTFWTQAITAEVYTLHLLLVGAALLALLAWAERPTVGRLALFYAIYALGFGNHLSMILLLPALAVFLVIQRRPGAADPLRPRMIACSRHCDCRLGALQYAWNFRGLWTELEPPASLGEAFGKFWFDVTKADWRETLVMSVSEAGLKTRPAMYWFDLRQQFGVPGVAARCARTSLSSPSAGPARGVLLLLLYAANLAFAWTYNVGDAYIFFLPSHYIVALCAGAGVAAVVAVLSRFLNRTLAVPAGSLLLAYPVWRGYDTFPAVDRSWDNRAVKLLEEFTAAPDNVVFGVDSNWQVQNAFEYFMREHRPGIAWFATEELEWLEWPGGRDWFEAFVTANAQAERDVIVTPRVHEKIRNPPTSLWQHDPTTASRAFSAEVKFGSPWRLRTCSPSWQSDPEYPSEHARVRPRMAMAARPNRPCHTTDATPSSPARVGERSGVDRVSRPSVPRSSHDRALDVDIRMESWLPTDTIRRAGFGHVIVNGRHALTHGTRHQLYGACPGCASPSTASAFSHPFREFSFVPILPQPSSP